MGFHLGITIAGLTATVLLISNGHLVAGATLILLTMLYALAAINLSFEASAAPVGKTPPLNPEFEMHREYLAARVEIDRVADILDGRYHR